MNVGAVTQQRTTRTNDQKKLMDTCREFESILTHSMLKTMRGAGTQDGIIEKNNGQEIFEDLRDMEIAKELSKGQGAGLATALYQQLSRQFQR